MTSAPADWTVTSGTQAPDAVETLLRSLPEWFGIESSIVDYVASARKLPTYLAWPGDGVPPGVGPRPAGVLLAARHFPQSAEIHLMAVARPAHRSGAGRALVDALERDLVAEGVTFLQVKTLGPAHPDPGYARTRLFYQALGFIPLEENHDLWGSNPCLIMIKSLPASGG